MDTLAIYESINENSTDEEKIQACKAILEADGDRALAIYNAVNDEWWRNDIAEPCQAILESPDNRSMVISYARQEDWWKDLNKIKNKSDNHMDINKSGLAIMCGTSIRIPEYIQSKIVGEEDEIVCKIMKCDKNFITLKFKEIDSDCMSDYSIEFPIIEVFIDNDDKDNGVDITPFSSFHRNVRILKRYKENQFIVMK